MQYLISTEVNSILYLLKSTLTRDREIDLMSAFTKPKELQLQKKYQKNQKKPSLEDYFILCKYSQIGLVNNYS